MLFSMFSFVFNKHCQQRGPVRKNFKANAKKRWPEGVPKPRIICFPKLSINCTPINPTLFKRIWKAPEHCTSMLQQPQLRSFPLLSLTMKFSKSLFPSFYSFRGVEGECEPAVKQMFLICC